MQKNNLIQFALLIAATLPFASNAVGNELDNAINNGGSIGDRETVVKTDSQDKAPILYKTSSATIARISAKQLKLFELELDAKIKQATEKKTGMPSFAPGSLQIPLPVVPRSVPASNVKAKRESSDLAVTAIYGKNNQLTADISNEGQVYSVSKNSGSVAGWKVLNVLPTHVILKKNGRLKKIFLSLGSKSRASLTNEEMPL